MYTTLKNCIFFFIWSILGFLLIVIIIVQINPCCLVIQAGYISKITLVSRKSFGRRNFELK